MSEEHRIVVGIDGSAASRAALGWAVWHAERTGGSITAIQVWEYPELYEWPLPGPEEVTRSTAKALNETVRQVAGDTSVRVAEEVMSGHPAKTLLNAVEEKEADLLVVGNRGHGGFTGALLGSIGQYCVQHAQCPVVVVRAR